MGESTKTTDFQARVKATITAAQEAHRLETLRRETFSHDWLEARRILMVQFRSVQAALADAGVPSEVRFINGGLHLFTADYEIYLDPVLGESVTWTERRGGLWEAPEGLTPKPLNLDWWNMRLIDFVRSALDGRLLSLEKRPRADGVE